MEVKGRDLIGNLRCANVTSEEIREALVDPCQQIVNQGDPREDRTGTSR